MEIYENTVTEDYSKSLKEVYTVLSYMSENNIKKISNKTIEFIKNNMDDTYVPNISKDIPISEQELSKDAKVLLSLLYRNYLCDKEMKELLEKEDIAALKEQEKIVKEKYNPDNLFAKEEIKEIKEDNKQEVQQEYHLVEYRIPFYKKILKRIKKILGIDRW